MERLSSQQIRKIQRSLVIDNLDTLGIALPPRLYRRGAPSKRAIDLIMRAAPELGFQLISVGEIGLSIFLPDLNALREAIPGIRFGEHLLDRVSRRQPPTSLGPEESVVIEEQGDTLEKKHFISKPEQTKAVPITTREIYRRTTQLNSFFSVINEDRLRTQLVGNWLVSQLNQIFYSPIIYLFDLVHPSELTRKQKNLVYTGTYKLSEFLGIDRKLGMVLEQVMREFRELESYEKLCEDLLGPVLQEIKKYLIQFDNPDQLVATALNVIRQQTQKYFPQ